MKKFDKIDPERLAKSAEVFAELRTDRFFWKASGYTDAELDRPAIAIANSPQDAGLGHMHLRQLGDAVKQGVLLGGGVPIEFSTIAPCAGHCRDLGLDDEVMLYDLPQRDAIADSVEIQMRNYNAKGLVCIGTCDKIVPGHWLGAARIDLPTIFLPGGPARPGSFRGQPTAFPTDVALTLIHEYLSEKIDAEQMRREMHQMEGRWVTGCGACPELTTANTVQMATEVMGLCLPGASTTPGNDMEKLRQAKETAFRIVELVKEGLRFSDLVTAGAIRDATRLIMALAAGTNGILHLLSLARWMELAIDIDTFDFLSDDTPYYCPVRPSGPFTVVDLHEAGGVMATRALLDAGHGRIAFAKYRDHTRIYDRRQAGWAAALQEAGIAPRGEWVIDDPGSSSALANANVTAVVCGNAPIASHLQQTADAAGLRVPEDLSIVCFDHFDSAGQAALCPFAAVAHPLAQTVGRGVGMLIDLIEDETPAAKHARSSYTFHHGPTIAPPRK